jgi:hypothetical protein
MFLGQSLRSLGNPCTAALKGCGSVAGQRGGEGDRARRGSGAVQDELGSGSNARLPSARQS